MPEIEIHEWALSEIVVLTFFYVVDLHFYWKSFGIPVYTFVWYIKIILCDLYGVHRYFKVGYVFPLVDVYILPHAEFGRIGNQKDAPRCVYIIYIYYHYYITFWYRIKISPYAQNWPQLSFSITFCLVLRGPCLSNLFGSKLTYLKIVSI